MRDFVDDHCVSWALAVALQTVMRGPSGCLNSRASIEAVRVMNIVCISHLRWDFVLQRPQHLLNRAAQEGRVLYVEEPMWGDWPRTWT